MKRYNRTAIFFHWITALLVIATFGLGITMVDIPGFTPTKLKYINWHKWMGVTVLFLAVLRLLWRLRHPAPAYEGGMPSWQVRAAHAMHVLLYVLIFAVPLSGYFFSLAAGFPVVYLGVVPLPVLISPDPGLRDILLTLHHGLNVVLFVCVIAHVLAVVKHLIARDGIASRMLP